MLKWCKNSNAQIHCTWTTIQHSNKISKIDAENLISDHIEIADFERLFQLDPISWRRRHRFDPI